MHELVDRIENALGENKEIVVLGCEATIGKAITVIEIVKRKMKEGSYEQKNRIYRKEFKYLVGDQE